MTVSRITKGSSLSDDALMEGVKGGRIVDFQEIFLRYADVIVRFLVGICGNQEEAKDITQEVFLKVYERRASYEGKGRFKSWLFTVARNTFYDFCRKRSIKAIGGEKILKNLAASEKEPGEIGNPQGLEFAVSGVLSSLTQEQRELLIFRFVERLSYAEISEITGIHETNLRKTVSRTILRLREEVPENEMRRGE